LPNAQQFSVVWLECRPAVCVVWLERMPIVIIAYTYVYVPCASVFIGVNPGSWTPEILNWGSRRSWLGREVFTYILFCTGSMLESGLF